MNALHCTVCDAGVSSDSVIHHDGGSFEFCLLERLFAACVRVCMTSLEHKRDEIAVPVMAALRMLGVSRVTGKHPMYECCSWKSVQNRLAHLGYAAHRQSIQGRKLWSNGIDHIAGALCKIQAWPL